MKLMQQLTDEINSFLSESDSNVKPMTLQEVAMGYIAVANETMCRPIRSLTQASCGRGF